MLRYAKMLRMVRGVEGLLNVIYRVSSIACPPSHLNFDKDWQVPFLFFSVIAKLVSRGYHMLEMPFSNAYKLLKIRLP